MSEVVVLKRNVRWSQCEDDKLVLSFVLELIFNLLLIKFLFVMPLLAPSGALVQGIVGNAVVCIIIRV